MRFLTQLKKFFKQESGFTLIELIVSLIVGAILAASITPFMRTSVMSYEASTSITEAYQSSRIAFNRLLSELRMIPRTSDVTSISSSAITFWDRTPDEIIYTYSGGQLLRNGYAFVDNVSSFTITPKDSAGNSRSPAAYDDYVWSYEIEITIAATIGDQTRNITLAGEVFPRNYHLD